MNKRNSDLSNDYFWELFYRKYKKLFIYVAREYRPESQFAEDVVAETMLILMNNKVKIRETVSEEKLSAYSCGIVRNVARQLLRKNYDSKIVSIEDVINKENAIQEHQGAVFEEESIAENVEQIRLALSKLSKEYQEVLQFRYNYSLSYEQMSSILNISEESLRKKVSRAKQMIKKTIVENMIKGKEVSSDEA